MLTGILEKMVGVHGGRPQPPSGAIATIVLVVTLIADVRAVVGKCVHHEYSKHPHYEDR